MSDERDLDTAPVVDDAEQIRLHGDCEVISAADTIELGQTWNQIARCGEFRGHKYPFTITPKVLSEMEANFRATRNQHIQVDYEHASEQDPALLANGGAPAVAWVRDLQIRGSGDAATLWALFDWVDPAAVKAVRERRYKYLSPTLTMESRHPETGKSAGAKLWSVGLVNRPFIDGMAPVTASDAPDRKFKPTAGMVAAFRRGLALHEEGHGGDGLKAETVAWAKRIVDGESITRDKLVDMAAWFARHDTPDERAARKRQEPSPALVAWLLWGGDPGKAWSAKKRAQLEKIESAEREAQGDDEDLILVDVPESDALTTAADSPAWDGSAAVEALRKWAGGPEAGGMDWGRYARGFAWHDTEKPEEFGSYKLPFMDVVDGDLRPNPSGVAAALAALHGARGGVDIPESDKSRVQALLEKHRKRANSAELESGSSDAEIRLDGNSAAGRFPTMEADKVPAAEPSKAALTPDSVHVPSTEPKHNCANKFARAVCTAMAPLGCSITLSDDMDYEKAEVDMLGQIGGLVQKMTRLQEAEQRTLRAEAETHVALALKAGAIDSDGGDDCIEAAVQLRLSDAPMFERLYGRKVRSFIEKDTDAEAKFKVLAALRPTETTSSAEVRRILSAKMFQAQSPEASGQSEAEAREQVAPPAPAESATDRDYRILLAARQIVAEKHVDLDTAIRMAERVANDSTR